MTSTGTAPSCRTPASSTPHTQNGELIAFEDTATKTVTFAAAGSYRVAILHGEYGDWSAITAYVKSPSMAAEAPISPSSAPQAGLWSTDSVGAVDLSGTNVIVNPSTTTSRLRALSDVGATVANLTLGTNSTLTLEGAKISVAGATTFNPGSTLVAGIDGADLGAAVTNGGQSNIGFSGAWNLRVS